MSDLSDLKLFTTGEHDCSYLSEQKATTLFVDPTAAIDSDLYSALSQLGFRRSGGNIYRPHCHDCSACISVRVPVHSFIPSRNQKRCLKLNSDLDIEATQLPNMDEHYSLYEHYIEVRHNDGDMHPPSRQQYLDFLNNPLGCTDYIEFREKGVLIGCAVSDRLDNGLSAIYTYFCPQQTARSLGRFAILYQIERARLFNLPYLYLGYWIRNCEKMNYKSQYKPLQLLINQQWITTNSID
ncbi:arginyltransferase [Marinagarivorans cellulosilyticus]|uniref:Aspartate/glutamate leucyltransferase n=1 Tax=Marinagarivorans cellulosilyticus TaxID=2721545 RepID=A0AAN1WJ55_9GAMM|nr:arginyltransferase [Marinagarivorans cellulosilyticus]BCD98525.1 leucyl-tRNA---protein transferase [Marinagarivorans cellulosilyticus]